MTESSYNITIKVETMFLPEQSLPQDDRYVFAYNVTITNQSELACKLLNRYWLITDGNGKTQEVRGDGVVGEQPYLQPGESYRYTSGTVMDTPVGTMEGHYMMQADDGVQFEAPIPLFSLVVPQALN